MMNEMLKTGVGVGFLPRSFCKAHQGRVYFSTWPPVQTFNGVFYLKDRQLSEAERYFIYLMIKNSLTSESRVGTNVYFNKISRAIINEFGGFEIWLISAVETVAFRSLFCVKSIIIQAPKKHNLSRIMKYLSRGIVLFIMK